MTRIDFYILETASQQQRLDFVCRWIQKAQRSGATVMVAVDNEAQAKYLDQLLWRFKPESFLPHDCQGSAQTGASVVISYGEDFVTFHDCRVTDPHACHIRDRVVRARLQHPNNHTRLARTRALRVL